MVQWDIIGYVISSKYRKKALLLLQQKPHTPREIASVLDIHMSHTSQILQQLTFKNLIVCLNPNVAKGRLYGLTDLGKEIVEKLESLG
ncbi:MAG: transcriptional regulator [Promethearchaeota archaeon]|jgi:predicted transcriptional regulator